jgi:hypothetical protein
MTFRNIALTFAFFGVAALPVGAFAALPNAQVSGIGKTSAPAILMASKDTKSHDHGDHGDHEGKSDKSGKDDKGGKS